MNSENKESNDELDENLKSEENLENNFHEENNSSANDLPNSINSETLDKQGVTKTLAENSNQESNLSEENLEESASATTSNVELENPEPQTLAVTEKKKRNNYKIAFFTLGGIILLGATSFFGYKYYKSKEVPVAVVEENTCLDTNTKVYDAYKDAVVLIRHKYAYFAKINGKEFQITVPDVKEEILYGSGFFVDREGSILTNRHVLQPWDSSDDQSEKIESNIYNLKLKISSILTTDISKDNYENFINENWENASNSENYGYEGDHYEDNENSGEEFVSSEEVSIDSVDIAASIPQKDYVSFDDIEVYIKTVELTIALHNSNDEWLNCDFVKVSDDSNIDLGVLQLSDHKTPESVTNIVNLDNLIEDDKSLKPGEKAIMIGYPLGMDLAQTDSGIKVQLYNGQISKESDGNKIQYSITSTHGASGAPVFNGCGELVAVNFSGLDQVQGFNFGIVAKHIRSLIATKPIKNSTHGN